MGPGVESSGGSAANTIAGIASLGGNGAFIGKVANDQLGEVFRHDIRAIGVAFETAAAARRPADRALPDPRHARRPAHDEHLSRRLRRARAGGRSIPVVIAARKVTYLEGYLWDPPRAKEAFLKAAEIARSAGRKVALTLSDPFCVDRYRDEFRELVENHVDILFANENEIMLALRGRSFDAALQASRGNCEIAALTRSEKGSVIVAGDEVHVIDAAPRRRTSSTPPAPAISTPPASSSAGPTGKASPAPRAHRRPSPPPKSSATSAPGRRRR